MLPAAALLLLFFLSPADGSEIPRPPSLFVVFGDGTKSESEIFDVVRSSYARLDLEAREAHRQRQKQQPDLIVGAEQSVRQKDVAVLVLEPTRGALEGALVLGYEGVCGVAADAIAAVGPAGLQMAVAAAFLHGVVGAHLAGAGKFACPAEAIPPIFITAQSFERADVRNWSLKMRVDVGERKNSAAEYADVPVRLVIGRNATKYVTADDYLFVEPGGDGDEKSEDKIARNLRALGDDPIAEARVLSCLYDPRVQWMRDYRGDDNFAGAGAASGARYSSSAFPVDRALSLARKILSSTTLRSGAESFLRDAFCLPPELPTTNRLPPGIFRRALDSLAGAAFRVWDALIKFAAGWNRLLAVCAAWFFERNVDIETDAVAISASVISAVVVLLASAACWWFLCPRTRRTRRGPRHP